MLTIRDATPRDAEAIAEINAAGWRTAYRGLVPDERIQGISVRAWTREIRGNLSEPADGYFSLVAEEDGRVVGSCFLLRKARDGDLDRASELVAIYVHPDHWRRGVGASLIGEVLRRTPEWGTSEIALWTLVRNEPAIAFYRRFGWSPDGSRQMHPAARALALRMQRELDGQAPTGPAQ
jgi:GNAT superfamily N-acetyltransferase